MIIDVNLDRKSNIITRVNRENMSISGRIALNHGVQCRTSLRHVQTNQNYTRTFRAEGIGILPMIRDLNMNVSVKVRGDMLVVVDILE